MKPYRIKHVPTGLYYKPGENNLSKTGKVYQTGCNVLTTYYGHIPVSVRNGSKIHEATKGKIQWKPARYKSWCCIAQLPKTDFIKEEI